MIPAWAGMDWPEVALLIVAALGLLLGGIVVGHLLMWTSDGAYALCCRLRGQRPWWER